MFLGICGSVVTTNDIYITFILLANVGLLIALNRGWSRRDKYEDKCSKINL